MKDFHIYDNMKVELIDKMGNDDRIVQAARVSTKGANEVYVADGVSGLIQYLMRERHGSPFEHVVATFYVAAPIFVFREFQRHRMASYNEISGRYAELPGDFYIPSPSRKLVNIGSSAKPVFAEGTTEQYLAMEEGMLDVYRTSWTRYQEMLANGVSNEVARMVLPVGIFSQMYVTMNLRSLFNFLSLRVQDAEATYISRPQREIEMVAQQIEEEVKQISPLAHRMFVKHGRVAP